MSRQVFNDSFVHVLTRSNDVISKVYKDRTLRQEHQFVYRNAMDNITNFALGNNRYVKVCEWKDEKRVDLREWENDKPTKKGISLTLMRWKQLVVHSDNVDEALKNNDAYTFHLGGNVYITTKKDNPCVDIRQYWKPEEVIVPTKKGLCLRPSEYQRLKEVIPSIGEAIPELSSVVPCVFRSDHANQLGFLQCAECNPNDYMKW